MDIMVVLALAGLAVVVVVGSIVGIWVWAILKIRRGEYVRRTPTSSSGFESDTFVSSTSISHHTTND
ncbi:hypothetical protein [Nocardioides marmotae]|uniref:Uncharacterized protein n=1 Tax=Nocardioides marmotae TaxID=2663857 RepID=A0A6I3JG29_9ACTN|nr:hypothetical protein [Nocardioides marmotae]MCR6033338.1 hypothetical protein [Gordonia jinghuaiqii]MBC9734090.1 hypothetical protein [Nocardioides marmotae]MTB85193.1 hypothetical protein [Nocardioides marmotae]MTB96995.1 hypothetical protein [Nocardioides marmotae]QKE00627.1 hypothetical protein HPC71_05675 [Nocardioides marmotae]